MELNKYHMRCSTSIFKQFTRWYNFPNPIALKASRTSCEHHLPPPPHILSSPTIPSSGLIRSILWSDCRGEKDVAEANKRIITKGSKRLCKSIPSGHGGFCRKQRKSKKRQAWQWSEREGVGVGGQNLKLLTDTLLSSSNFLCAPRFSTCWWYLLSVWKTRQLCDLLVICYTTVYVQIFIHTHTYSWKLR